ncbi:LLM class flavin-dependent oxidoreductase [Nocardia sp. NPDC059239]|uniref:LLM class flavin-dependent oxidoreductase n=1 Tax=Nocardia sp. NPDC059239 TaxID=3346785 RepID=UPI00369DF9B6
MTTTPKIGFLSHICTTGDPKRALDEAIRLCVAAEQLGYQSMWVAQHHFGAEDGVVPSPFVFLATLAAHTSRIRLGTAVVTLSLEDPIRAAEDAALVDLLSGNRLEVGLGTGAHQPTFDAMSREYHRRSATTDINVGVLVSALSGDPLPGGAVLVPRSETLTRRIWRATSSRKGATVAARLGHGLLLGRSAPLEAHPVGEVQRPIAEEYLAVSAAQGHVARLAVTRTIVPTCEPSALANLARHARRWGQEDGLPVEFLRMSDAEVLDRHGIVTGDLHEIRARLPEDRTACLATDLIVQFQPGRLSLADSLTALETLAHLRIRPA